MKFHRYRIIKLTNSLKLVTYNIQERYWLFFWHTLNDFDKWPIRMPKVFYSEEKAREYIQYSEEMNPETKEIINL